MPIPTYDLFIEPVMRYLLNHPEGAKAADVHNGAADLLGLSEEEREVLLSSGSQAIYKNRSGWAYDRLKRKGLARSPRRGWWKLTIEGETYIKNHPAPLTSKQVVELTYVDTTMSLKNLENDESTNDKSTHKDLNSHSDVNYSLASEKAATPDERLESAVKEIREVVAQEILDALSQVSPAYFERVVLDVLHSMGYGATKDDLKKVGGSGDGGIDGVISLDKLGLEKVYVQAKRWGNSVGRPEVQGFYGAIKGLRANKGVMITTSTFSQKAYDFAKATEGFVLVDGNQLAQLMMDHGVGVSLRSIKIPRLDSDYFEGEI